MILYDFTRSAEHAFLKLPKDVQIRIIRKVEDYLSRSNPLSFAKRISGSPVLSFRFQVGDYRIIFDWEKDRILIAKVGHRREVYL